MSAASLSTFPPSLLPPCVIASRTDPTLLLRSTGVYCDPRQIESTDDDGGVPLTPPSSTTSPAGEACLGRWKDGKYESYQGYGMGECLRVNMNEGCPLSDKTVPAGTCTLKSISSPRISDHLW